MIPKIIHCIWLGGRELPALERKCIESWSVYNNDYEIIIWNESNLVINEPEYKNAYQKKQWAYCADLARMKILYEHGGFYLDTDMEVIKSFDSLLTYSFFAGKEDNEMINGAILGAEKGNEFVLSIYEEVKKSLRTNFIPIPRIITYIYNRDKNLKGVKIFEKEVFYPFNPYASPIKQLLYQDIHESTIAIHHWSKSWNPSFFQKCYRRVKRVLAKSKYY